MRKHWLVLDIGNTHTVAGVYAGVREASGERFRVRFRTDPHATADEYRAHLTQLFSTHFDDVWSRIERAIVATVVPMLESVVKEACRETPSLFIHSTTRREFDLDLPVPSQLGADRLANVAGALTLCRPPFLIVDAGTATTFCLVDERPAYIGGAIAPGLEISWKALQSRAAKLFSVELRYPETTVGNTTETQLQSGVLVGYEAMIEGMADRLLRDASSASRFSSPLTLFATGGCIQSLRLSSRFRIEPDLTLLGLLRYGTLTE